MNKNNNYAFYGSLRKGMYNYEHFKLGLTYHKTVEVEGFRLFSLGSFPCVIRTEDPKDKLTVDLFTATPDTAHRIDRMERGASYDYEEITVDDTNYGIYTWDISTMGRLTDRRVPGGDWVKHLQPKVAEEEQV